MCRQWLFVTTINARATQLLHGFSRMTRLFHFTCDCWQCRGEWIKFLVLCQYVPLELVNEILQMDEAFYQRHIDTFRVVHLSSTMIDTLSNLGLMILYRQIPNNAPLGTFLTPSLSMGKHEEILTILKRKTQLPATVVPLFTVLNKQVEYDASSHTWSIQINAKQRLSHNGYFYSYHFDGFRYDISAYVVKALLKQRLLPWQNVCAHCFDVHVKTLPTCYRCLKTAYCCSQCQRKDWPSHKLACSVQLK